MPAGKSQQSNAMLYTVITFVGLFIIATVFATIYYIKFEEQRTIAETKQSQTDELAGPAELRKIGTLIGERQHRKSWLGTMVDYLDQTVYLIIGGPPEETSAQVKVNTAGRKVKDLLELLAREYPDIENTDPNTTGLIVMIEKLKTKLDNITTAELAAQERFNQLQKRFDDAMTVSFEKEQTLLAENEKYQQQVKEIKQNYSELEALLRQTSEQQVMTLMAQLDEVKAERNKLNQELLKTQAQLKMAEDRIEYIQQKIHDIMPAADSEVAAYKPDGKILLIDDQTKIVHLNIGSEDHVYRGLTFSVYDKNMPIPKDGKGKAEIEVFTVGKNISAAQIIRSETNRPVVLDDIVANLIWDSEKTNVFVVAGEFDLDNNGDIEHNAVDKIKTLIEKWGSRVSDTVSIDTDFIVLGKTPKIRKKPTFEEMEVYPMAMEKYEASLQRRAHYKEVQSLAQALSVPVFNTERFLYFIGYETQASRPGAF